MKNAVLVLLLAVLALPGCASVTLKPVDYSWSFESVLTADAAGYVRAEPKTIAFDAGGLFRAEAKDAGAAAGKIVRIIRDREGYYYITSPGFRHVYIFDGAHKKLTLKKRVLVAEQGMAKPFFNLRDQGIELVADGRVFLLNKKGIVPGGKK